MSILASLAQAYERLPDNPPFGYSYERVGCIISLDTDGSIVNLIPKGSLVKNKWQGEFLQVPQGVKRSSNIAPNFLWDKTSYALGVSHQEDAKLLQQHAAFVEFHLSHLGNQNDEGLKALYLFLTNWRPELFSAKNYPEEIKDQNVVFCLEKNRLSGEFIHNRPDAKDLWGKIPMSEHASSGICLIKGELGGVARLHPSIKGVFGGQSSGCSLVSFNESAYESYGREQGDNAPVSESVAFAYTTALNRFLEKDSRNKIQIGDATTVFWADASDAVVATVAEGLFSRLLGSRSVDEMMQASRVGDILGHIRAGKPLKEIAPELTQGVRFYVLGLSPNAARLSIRFWLADDFGRMAMNYQRFMNDMRLEPSGWEQPPGLWRYLGSLALREDLNNLPPKLAGDWLRSILNGTAYPQTLLSTSLMRIRADHKVDASRVAILRAVLVRNFNMEKEAPMALDEENTNKGYLLGRLFAVYEQVQKASSGGKINATVKDKFYGSASAQPRKVFALLEKLSATHLSKLGRTKPGYRVVLERNIADIMGRMAPGQNPFPASLAAEEQALFGLGYYHQHHAMFQKQPQPTPTVQEEIQ